MLNCQGNTLKRWNHEFPVRLHSNFKKAPEAVFLTQIATNSNPRAQSEVKKKSCVTVTRKACRGAHLCPSGSF
ncbi:hypothetical protein S245_015917 [Arachis hypogaea]